MPSNLEYKPHKPQAEAHRAFLVDGYDRGTLFWGRQVGKSLWSVKHLEMAAAYKQGPYHIIFNTHKHAKQVMWKQYLHMIPKSLIYETNAQDLEITFNYIKMPIFIPDTGWKAVKHDRSYKRSTIRLLGSDYADDDRGLKSNGMVFDEYQDQDPVNWEAVYKYFLTTTKGWAAFMGTAKGYNHWWELLEYAKQPKNKRWYYLEATWRDNPVVDPAWIQAEREEAEDKGQLDIFMQEVELQFRTAAGSVYKWFDRETHVISETDRRIPENGTVYATWDFGWSEGHPTAINVVNIDNMGTWFVTNEIHGLEIPIDECLSALKTQIGDRKLTGIVCDSARPDLIDQVRKAAPGVFGYVVPIIPAPKRQNSVADGIQLFATMIKPKVQLTGKPEPDIYFTENLKMTIYQMENYRYREIREDRPVSDIPVKKDDDHPDGLRYLRLYLKYGTTVKRKREIKKQHFNSFGMMVK